MAAKDNERKTQLNLIDRIADVCLFKMIEG